MKSGAIITYTVPATVAAGASGNLINSATVTAPAGVFDPTPANNTATDSDAVNTVADLAIVKSNGVSSVTAGGTTAYTITVTNNGPSSVVGAILADPAVAGLTKTAVVCSGTPGQCAAPPSVAQLESGSFALPTLASGATYQIVVIATVTAASGTVTNTATIAPPSGTSDPTPGNNSATDSDAVIVAAAVADLAVTKTNGAGIEMRAGATPSPSRITARPGDRCDGD
jgi:uncharacterized repeat protein (TIGR01451 family)